MGDSAILLIAIAESKGAVERAGEDIYDQLVAAMRASRDSMAPTQDTQFRAAIGAVMQKHGEGSTVYRVLKKELLALDTLNAMARGIPVDIGGALSFEEGEQAYGVVRLWQAITKGGDVAAEIAKLRPKPTPEDHAKRGLAKCPFCGEAGEALEYEHKGEEARATCQCGASGPWEASLGCAAKAWNDVVDALEAAK